MLIIAQGYWLVGNGVLITLAKPTIDEADLTYRYVMLGGSSTIFPAFPASSPAGSPAQTRPVDTDPAAWEKNEVAWEFYLRSRWKRRNPASAVVALVQPRAKNTQKTGPGWADKIIAKAGQVNDCMQQLLLPLLYGWLGAMAYILRTAPSRHATVSSDRKIKWSGTCAAG
jgi:hypothetical protein